MTSTSRERFRAVDELFDRALDLPPAERDAFVASACAGDAALRDEVRALLQAHADSADFLESPAVELGARLLADPDHALPPAPERAGPFRIVRKLGHGGMGVVYLAEREGEGFEQRVALKLIRHAGRPDGLSRRFVEERRILALLEHPGIARLVDGGLTEHGEPYFAMELVEGEPIDVYCDARRLGIDQRLDVVAAMCDAVQYAHEHLVIHRDLKPSNVLVRGDGQLKLLDFGIAKLLDPLRTDGDAPTQTGVLALTPECAAPEQVRGEPVGTSTDTYAIGMLLYWLLAGRRPYEVRGRTPAEVERVVCEVEPARPSETFGGKSPDAHRDDEERARARGTTPDRLRRRLRGDLDLIVMKAIHKDPARRYSSAAALRDDLRRFRDGLPIRARPDSTTYRLRKFARRNRIPVAAAVTVAAVLVGAMARERALRARAEAEASKARAVQEYVVSVFDVANPFAWPEQRGEDVTARTLLDRGARRVDTALVSQPEVQAELRGVLGLVYTKLGLFGDAIPQLERSLDQRRSLYGPRHIAVAAAMDQLGDALREQSQFDRAEPLLRDALALRRELLGNGHAATAESLDHLATLLQARSRYDEAEPLFREALAIRRALPERDELAVAGSLTNLGLLLWFKAAYDQAEPIQREALAIQLPRLGENHPLTAQTLNNLAQVQQLRGNIDEAEGLFRRALAAKRKSLGDGHPSVTVAMNNLGFLLLTERNDAAEAETLVREALRLDRQIFGARHEYVASSLTNLGTVLIARGELAEAERAHREALEMRRALYGARHTAMARNIGSIGSVRYLRGELDSAIALYGEAMTMYRDLVGDAHPSYIVASVSLARALAERGAPDDGREAESLLRPALEKLDPAKPAQYAALVTARVALGRCLTRQGRLAEATAVLERAVATSQQRYGPEHWRTAEARLMLGESLAAAGQRQRAAQLVRDASAALGRQSNAQPHLARSAAAREAKLARE